jgi:Rrf2 family protein
MKLITKHTDYAVRALAYLAKRRGKFFSSRRIAESQKIPLPFLRRILQTLIKERIIQAKEGIDGGSAILKTPERISLAAIMELFQGKIEFSQCMFRRIVCANRANCSLRKKIRCIERKVIKEFENITIRDLMI